MVCNYILQGPEPTAIAVNPNGVPFVVVGTRAGLIYVYELQPGGQQGAITLTPIFQSVHRQGRTDAGWITLYDSLRSDIGDGPISDIGYFVYYQS